MNHKNIAVFLVCAVTSSVLTNHVLSAAPSKKTHVLFILSDDHTWRDMGAYGNADVHTPNLDRLAITGMRFDRAFAAAALCTPARLAIASGQWPHGFEPPANRHQSFLVSAMRRAGYRTVSVAKTIPGDFHDRIRCGKTTARPAADYIAAYDRNEPMFMIFGAQGTHVEWPRGQAARLDAAKFSVPPNQIDTPETRERLRAYYSAVTHVDLQVGELLAALDAKGWSDDTLVIYSSDQGASFPFAKWCLYDDGIRVPLLIRHPRRIAAGSSTSAMVSQIDFAATLLDFTGTDPSGSAGRSFLPVLTGKQTAHREAVFASHRGDHGRGKDPAKDGMPQHHHNRNPALAIRTTSHKLIVNTRPSVPFGVLVNGYCNTNPNLKPNRPVTGFWQSWQRREAQSGEAAALVRRFLFRPKVELFDLDADPWEMQNLAPVESHSSIRDKLKSRLNSWRVASKITLPDYGPGKPEEQRRSIQKTGSKSIGLTATTKSVSRAGRVTLATSVPAAPLASKPISISGIYPHLTMRNKQNECGTGAVVVWQGSLWAITYAPHRPAGSDDKLYEVAPDLTLRIFEGSVGGTPANRMIHRESNQLLIGPYLIDAKKNIRVIPPAKMYGRLTGNARHLTDPARKVYYATMEEGLYEVDVKTLEVKCHIRDGHGAAPKTGVVTKLLGYHGKGLYSGHGRVVYSNNGDKDPRRRVDPTVPSGALATWQGEGDWQLVRRNQFTEVTGPGGIHGNSNPATDPIWAMGWDARSLILALLENKTWHYYRLPKGSHSYDGAHGFNTEWPRIREIGEKYFLATMHGTFWRFPSVFSLKNSSGIAPRSNYLKVVGDFCRWNDRIVLGCDDSAKSEFLNTRVFKAKHGSPKQSNSNLWFISPGRLDKLGPAIGRGSVWLRDDVEANQVSEPYLFSGYDHRQLHLTHQSQHAVTFELEVDRDGTNQWQTLKSITVPPRGSVSHIFGDKEKGSWIRLTSQQAASSVTAHLQYRNRDPRNATNESLFDGVVSADKAAHSYGLMRSLAYDRLGLVAATSSDGKDAAYYELNQKMELLPVENSATTGFIATVQQPRKAITVDAASVVVVEDGKRYRLPKNDRYISKRTAAPSGMSESLEDHLSDHLAIGAMVKVSSTHANYAARNAVDGRITDDARWIGSNEGDTWIELDLGKPKTFQSIWVVSGWKNSSQYVAANFDAQIKRDGKWQTVQHGAIRDNTSVRREIVLKKAVTAQHLRLVSKTDGYLRIYEIALFANKLNIAPDSPGASGFSTARICREVATERDLLNLHGTFYELPARNAQGLAKIRPVATHNLAIHDFCSHNGLLLFTGIDADTKSDHIIRSADGKAAVWAGVVDDLWKLGKPRGNGGPWHNTAVKPNEPSDPYLMTGYDEKQMMISSSAAATIRLEVDVDGTGLWIPYRSFTLKAGESIEHTFPAGFSAYWVRSISDADTKASVTFVYR